MHYLTRFSFTIALACSFLLPSVASAALTEPQIEAVSNFLIAFDIDQAAVESLNTALRSEGAVLGTSTAAVAPPSLTGMITRVDRATYPDRTTLLWSRQQEFKNIPKGTVVYINGTRRVTTVETTVGNIYLPANTPAAVQDNVKFVGATPTPAPTCTLSAFPASITAGQSSTLSWTSAKATSISINNGVEAVTPVAAGSKVVSPTVTTTYTATATGTGGTKTCTATVTVANTVPPTASGACSAQKMAEILAPPKSGMVNGAVSINCNATLKSTDVVTKKVEFVGAGASNTTLDCNGATITAPRGAVALQVRSTKVTDTTNSRPENVVIKYSRPENVVIKNCKINGGVEVTGMMTGSSPFSTGHTKRSQDAAPRNITLDRLTINVNGTGAVNFHPGVTYSSLTNSNLSGEAPNTAIYFHPESAYNTIRNNSISVDTGGQQCWSVFCTGEDREAIALDGSANNLIVNNLFAHIRHGGIFLYRNCGERGEVRHQTPSGNKIINNYFYYGHSYASEVKEPAIWIGSRDGNRSYCGLDSAYPFGSGVDDRDFAQNNVVMQNQIRILSPNKMIRAYDLGNSSYSVNKPNYFFENVTAENRISRKAGCYVEKGYPDPFLKSGESITRFYNRDTGAVSCTGKQMRCTDGNLTTTNISCPATPSP